MSARKLFHNFRGQSKELDSALVHVEALKRQHETSSASVQKCCYEIVNVGRLGPRRRRRQGPRQRQRPRLGQGNCERFKPFGVLGLNGHPELRSARTEAQGGSRSATRYTLLARAGTSRRMLGPG